jgi:xanthine/uracil/vitamin C permease (AzgA family)
MILKRRQTIAKRIPRSAKTSTIIAIGRRRLFKTISGLPSGGIPSVHEQDGMHNN